MLLNQISLVFAHLMAACDTDIIPKCLLRNFSIQFLLDTRLFLSVIKKQLLLHLCETFHRNYQVEVYLYNISTHQNHITMDDLATCT